MPTVIIGQSGDGGLYAERESSRSPGLGMDALRTLTNRGNSVAKQGFPAGYPEYVLRKSSADIANVI